MSDDLSMRKPQDASKVNINEPWEVRYWCDKFGVTEADLKAAVRAVGVSADAVRRFLGK